jgi:lambda family phage portal protein
MMWFDDLVGVFSPQAKLRRVQARHVLSIVETHKRKYEGAGKTRRTAGWFTQSTSANAEIGSAIDTLRNRSRDLVRNNPYAARGVDLISTAVVGRGITPAFKLKNKRSQFFEDLWWKWAESTACDFDGRHTYYGIQRMVMRAITESGECLVIRRFDSKSKPLPLKLQVLEGDYLASAVVPQMPAGHRFIHGVEFDAKGHRVAYHLYKDHPGNIGALGASLVPQWEVVRVPADQVLHLYRVDRPGQVRGVPWLSPTIIKIKDFDEYEDAQLVRQKIAACWAAFIHDIETGSDPVAGDDDARNKFEPGMIETLPPGKAVTLASPPGVQNYDEYTRVILRSIATGLGITYETLTSDYSNVNFSSGRMGWIEMWRNIEAWRTHILDTQLNQPVLEWFKLGCSLAGISADDLIAAWIAPKREMIDPGKEITANIKGIRAGLLTLSDAVRQTGKDPVEHLEEIAADNQEIDRLGLILDSDPRNVNSSGSSRRGQEDLEDIDADA